MLAVVALSAACAKREVKTNTAQDMPVFIISIDTLRSDHLPAYGHYGSTPAIDAFRKDAVLFTRAFSQCPQTLPSHAAIMTGLLPPHNGVRDNLGYALSAANPTIASVLRQHGYATGAAVSSYVLRRATGIEQGFDFFDDQVDYSTAESPALAERNGDRTRIVLEKWLESTRGKRVFGFLHLYEPHAPYTPPPPFDRMANSYDGEIAYADSIVGRFLQTLKSRGLYDDALIVLLSDHGEGLGDHGEDEHGIFVYRESIQVPLMIKLAHERSHGETVRNPVALIDVAPTVLSALGLRAATPVDGRDILSGTVPSDRTVYSESYFPRLHLGWHELRSVISSKLHFIDAPHPELYNYSSDPAELRNVADAQRRDLAQLRSVLQTYDAPLQMPGEVDPEDQRKLAALGYIGSTSSSEANFPDPKERIETVRKFRRALFAMKSGRDAEAKSTLEALLRDDPKMVDAWGLLAQCDRRAGDTPAAIRSLKTAMTFFPHDPHVALALADVLAESGKLDEAAQYADLAVAQTPVLAHEMLARIAMARGNAARAGREIGLALDGAPNRVETLLASAAIRESQRDWAGELSLLDRAAAAIDNGHLAPVEHLQEKRGNALLQLRRAPEAAAAFREEVDRFPHSIEAWGNLAVIQGATGHGAEARQSAAALIEKNPGSPDAVRIAIQSLETIGDRNGAAALRDRYSR